MLNLITKRTPTETTPVLPQAPAGHFWRVTNRLFTEGGPYGDAYYYVSEDTFEVQLHRAEAPTRFRKRERSTIVASRQITPAARHNEGFTVADLTVAAAESVLVEVGKQTKIYNAIKQVVGDYR
jgi:hypothetical protein